MNQPIKKFLGQRIRKRYNKTLGTSVIKKQGKLCLSYKGSKKNIIYAFLARVL